MQPVLFVLILIMAAATLFILIKGVVGMAQGKDLTGMRSQQLMRKRVLYQAITIILVILFLLIAGGRH
ncbi:MAG TPA: HIG1 domain-containing protein [Allosphingosinicella sp.]|nr:HIG1 domain-containing protein [Allosphingosinicella sp.]